MTGILDEIAFSDPEVLWTIQHLPHVVIPKGNPFLRNEAGTMNAWVWQRWCLENLPALEGRQKPVWVHDVWNTDEVEDAVTLGDCWNCIVPSANIKSVEFRFNRAEHATLFKLYHG
jgi:hypothetical protein